MRNWRKHDEKRIHHRCGRPCYIDSEPYGLLEPERICIMDVRTRVSDCMEELIKLQNDAKVFNVKFLRRFQRYGR